MFSKTNPQATPAKAAAKPAETARKAQSSRPNSGVPSILAADLVITGEIVTEGDVQIEGRLDGNVKAATLTIGEQGFVNGAVSAGTCFIRGKVVGKITADTVDLAETANVQADIIQDHLTIANGAFFDGKCSRKTKPAGEKAAVKK